MWKENDHRDPDLALDTEVGTEMNGLTVLLMDARLSTHPTANHQSASEATTLHITLLAVLIATLPEALS